MNGFEKEVKDNGNLPSVSDLGGYPLIYFTDGGNILCGECATKEPETVHGRAAYFEGSFVQCDECGTHIESAYGNPEDEELTPEEEQAIDADITEGAKELAADDDIEEYEEDNPNSVYGKDIDCKHCDAKASVHISNSWANSCGECGGEHNGFGQPLAPRSQWGYDTGEEGDF